MIIVDYDSKSDTVKFYCESCDFRGEYDIGSCVSDNCAVDIDIICELCGDLYVLYVLKCDNEALADELNAKLNALRVKRKMEDSTDAN
jgi:hypothetical protein